MGLSGWVAYRSLTLCYGIQSPYSIASLQCLFWLYLTSPRSLGPLSLRWDHFGLIKDFASLDAGVVVPGTLKVLLVLEEMEYEG